MVKEQPTTLMASGRTHAAVAYVLQAPITVAGIVASTIYADAQFGLGLVIGGLVGVAITPDIDHHVTTHEEFRFYQLGRVPGVLWQWLWSGYEMMVPHRGVSHWPVIGTLTRALYLVAIVRVVLWTVAGVTTDACAILECSPVVLHLGSLWSIAVIFHRFWIGVLAGWIAQDFGHLFMDMPLLARVGVAGIVLIFALLLFRI